MTAKLRNLQEHLSTLTPKSGEAPAVRSFDKFSPHQPFPEPKRRCIWELSTSFHCSIIGTCLTTSELRQVLAKIAPGIHQETDHELHGRAVLLAGRRDAASKLLQKALDRRHRSAIGQFSKTRNAEELRKQWGAAVQRAEIPGAYWAVLTHPGATEDLVRHVFAEVHMLSHLVGAANRADIRRLRELETENVALQDKVARQQKQLRDAVVSREATIANLSDLLSTAIASTQHGPRFPATSDSSERETMVRLVGDLRRRLASESANHERIERQLKRLAAELDQERKQRQVLEKRQQELQDELDAAELSLTGQVPESGSNSERSISLAGITLLYVGGRTRNIAQLRILAEERGAVFLHHDGGIDDRSGQLTSHVARADLVYFPVDCVSHNAVAVVKRVTRNLGKLYVPLRSSGLTSFVMALRRCAPAEGYRGAASDLVMHRGP